MFQSKTLIVVGAGASKEARLPTGNELTATIASKIDIRFSEFSGQSSGDHEITAALKSHATDVDRQPGVINPYLHACRRIRDAMPQAISIDSFIEDHQGDEKIELCGKLAIVQSILEAERKSFLFFDGFQRARVVPHEPERGQMIERGDQVGAEEKCPLLPGHAG